jgi:hypothetical protein
MQSGKVWKTDETNKLVDAITENSKYTSNEIKNKFFPSSPKTNLK